MTRPVNPGDYRPPPLAAIAEDIAELHAAFCGRYFLEDVRATLDAADADPEVRAVILFGQWQYRHGAVVDA